MYKKIAGIGAVAILAISTCFVTRANLSNDSNVTLSDLLKVNAANAECIPNGGGRPGICIGGIPGNEQAGTCTIGHGPYNCSE